MLQIDTGTKFWLKLQVKTFSKMIWAKESIASTLFVGQFIYQKISSYVGVFGVFRRVSVTLKVTK